MRHTFTTWLKSAGASNALAQLIVGHDSEVVARGDTHLSANDTADALGKLPAVTRRTWPDLTVLNDRDTILILKCRAKCDN